ncbi:MAG: hypothetical protein ACKV2O_05830 [Acidimicrobiales bacterium]
MKAKLVLPSKEVPEFADMRIRGVPGMLRFHRPRFSIDQLTTTIGAVSAEHAAAQYLSPEEAYRYQVEVLGIQFPPGSTAEPCPWHVAMLVQTMRRLSHLFDDAVMVAG